jgi:uncharacterized protein
MAELGVVNILIAEIAVLVGATVQGVLGFGLALVATPVIVLLWPDIVPVGVVLVALPLTLAVYVRDRAHVDTRGLWWLAAGYLPGAVVGALVVTVLSTDARTLSVGVIVIVAAGITALRRPFAVSTAVAVAAGALAGVMNTTAGLAGPPVALVYQHSPGRVLRATSSALFAIGTAATVAVLTLAGDVGAKDLRVGLILAPTALLGVMCARLVGGHVDQRWLRHGVVIVSFVGGLSAVARGVF